MSLELSSQFFSLLILFSSSSRFGEKLNENAVGSELSRAAIASESGEAFGVLLGGQGVASCV